MVPGKPKDDTPTSDRSKSEQVDKPSSTRVVSARENGIGSVDHDERGRAKWKWSTEASVPAVADTGTFDLLKALDNDSLTLSQEIPALDPTVVDKKAGYNPYDAVKEPSPPKGFAGAKRNVAKPR
jgi:hypothetical protein